MAMTAAGTLVGGAALGALFGELLKATLDLGERAIHFKTVLEDIRLQLEFLSSLIEQQDKLPENTNDLGEIINKGKQLILKCEVVKESKLIKAKAPSYTKKLRNLDAKLQRASFNLLLQLNVEQMKKLTVGNNNEQGTFLLLVDKVNNKVVQKVIETRCSCGLNTLANPASPEAKLQLQFYHDKRLKGKVGPNFADGLLGRVVEHMKEESGKTSGEDDKGVDGRIEGMIKELGASRYEKILQRTFETVADEKLQNWFRCDLLTEAGTPLPGVLFVSTQKLAFCSHKHIPHHTTKNLYLKVVIPFPLLKTVGMKSSDEEEDEYIKLVSVDNQEFRFVNFPKYNVAKKCLQQVPVTTCSRCGN